jgi:hypothetical protein
MPGKDKEASHSARTMKKKKKKCFRRITFSFTEARRMARAHG